MKIIFEIPTKLDEINSLDVALTKCRKLERCIQLSIIQVVMLGRKYGTCDAVWENNRKSVISMPSNSSLETTVSADCFRENAGNPFSDLKICRSLQSIVQHNNISNIRMIKIKRSVETILTRVEFLVRLYCKPESRLRQPMERKKAVYTIVNRNGHLGCASGCVR